MAMMKLTPGAKSLDDLQSSEPSQPQAESNSSTFSSSPTISQASGVMALPPVPTGKRRGRPPGSRNKPKIEIPDPIEDSEEMVDEFAPKRRPLPEDETELERVLRKYRILAKPCVGGISSTLEVLGSSPLDKDEKEGGEFSIAAMLYEFGAEMDSRVLFALWTVGIAGPRLAEAALKKKSLEKQVANATPPKPV